MEKTRITIARGDGIGPEILDATLRILEAAGAALEYDPIEIGEKLYLEGQTSGIAPGSWDTIRRNRVLLKAPITTPLGGGYKSLNVTIRKALNLFVNVRPTKSYAPFVSSPHPGMNLFIVRENEADLHAGIEHQQTPEATQVLKLITRPGTERIIRYAFEYARHLRPPQGHLHDQEQHHEAHRRALLPGVRGGGGRVRGHRERPPDHRHRRARLAAQPEFFDVIVTLNLYGDILSDIASQIAGSVGLAGSANIGSEVAMFEAVHGSAPDIAGKGVANPSGLILAAVQLLVHVGQAEVAERIKNAWLVTLESGNHTSDIYRPNLSQREVGTDEFTSAIIERFGERPRLLTPVAYRAGTLEATVRPRLRPRKELVGVDVFLDWDADDRSPDHLGHRLEEAAPEEWGLKRITNRGVKVYPEGLPETFLTDHWRCRFLPRRGSATTFEEVLGLLTAIHREQLEVIKTEHLYEFDGERGYSLGQGQGE